MQLPASILTKVSQRRKSAADGAVIRYFPSIQLSAVSWIGARLQARLATRYFRGAIGAKEKMSRTTNWRRPKEVLKAEVKQWKEKWNEFLFGGTPPESQLTKPAIDPVEVFGDIERFHLEYEVESDVKVEAYLLRPKRLRGRLPGIICFHESGPTTIELIGSIDPRPETSIAARLATRGYVVLCPKCFIYGRGEFPAKDPRSVHRMEVQKMRERHPRWTGLSRMILDGIRAVDVLSSRTDVSPGKIGAIGHSLGGKQVLYVMAFEKRVKAGVSSDGGLGLTFSNWHDIWYLGPEIREKGFELENNQVLAMIAPRAFMLVGGKYDDDRAWPFIAGVMSLWDSVGKLNNINFFRHDAGHRFPPEAQQKSFCFLKQRLKG
jgi:dienelactone hydrolase